MRGRSWRAQGQLVVGMGLAFAIPYLAATQLATGRDRQWAKSGLSPHEVTEWRDNGFGSVSDAISWRNVGFKAPGALLWTEEGWRDASVARDWSDADFGPREAKHWRDQGFAVWEAGPWRQAGFQPQDARRWKNAGATPADAAMKRRKGAELAQ